jgi:hypothetical protein
VAVTAHLSTGFWGQRRAKATAAPAPAPLAEAA